MKQIFRSLTLAVMALVSGSAFAGDWTIPTPTFQELVAGDTVYVYNVGQQAFINQGEAWGTEAVVSKTAGLPFIMEAQTDGTYKLKNNSSKGWKWAKRVNGDSKAGVGNRTLFVDGAEDANNNTFTVTALGGNVYSIAMPKNESDEEYMTLVGEMGEGNFLVGVQPDHASQYVIDNSLTETAALWYDVAPSANTQWGFVAQSLYKAWAAKVDLLTLMNDAEGRGVATADAEAVLNNASASLEEVNAAITALNQAIANNVTPDNPRDASSLIKENDFEGGSHAAWTVTVLGGAGSDGKIQNVTIATNRCTDGNDEGVFDGHFFEAWDPSAYSAHMYQKVEGVPNGVYKAELAAFVNTADADNATNQTQYVFFNDTKVALQANNLNHNYTSFVFIDADTLNIGLAQDSVIANWMGIDNAKLTYYGNGVSSYTYYAQQVYEGAEIPEGSVYNDSYKTAFDEAYATSTAATTVEEAVVAAKALGNAYNALMSNISAYSKLATAVEKLETYLNSGYPLDDEWARAADMYDGATATTEEVLAEIEADEAAIESALKNNYNENDDVTKVFITNPTFDNSTETTAATAMSTKGWTVVSGSIGSSIANVAEAYNCSFDLYQDLTKMKKGAYKIEIQGFYRTTSGAGNTGAAGSNTGPAWDNWVAADGADEGDNKVYSYVYAGALQTPFNNMFSWEGRAEGDGSKWQLAGNGYYLPNDVNSAYEAFSEDNQYNITLTAIPVGNKMRLGLKNTRPTNASQWTIWNDFKLTYLGTSAAVTAPALTSLLAVGDEAAAKNMTAAHKEALNSAIATSNSVVAGADGDAIVAAYEALNNAIDDANTSIVYYDTLVTKADELQLAVDSKAETAKEEALANANSLLAEVNAGISAGSYSIDEAKAMYTTIDNAIAALNVPKGEASDNNPLDYTFMITNPGYTDNSTSGWTINKISEATGGSSTSASSNVLEGWNAAFETYQDITGLPQGTYRIDVKAAFRSEAADSASKYTLAGTVDLRGYMFAGTGADYSAIDSVLLKNIVVLDASLSANGSESSWSRCIDSTDVNNPIVYWFPNTRDAARDRFDNTTVYDNSLYATVGADGQLRIGVFNHNVKKNDWLLFSDWKLYYLGTNSAHATETGINTVSGKVASREYFTIDGRKVNVLNKGLNIIRESDVNGNVTIKKVIVK